MNFGHADDVWLPWGLPMLPYISRIWVTSLPQVITDLFCMVCPRATAAGEARIMDCMASGCWTATVNRDELLAAVGFAGRTRIQRNETYAVAAIAEQASERT